MFRALAPLHALELQPVGVEEEHGVIVVVVLIGGVDDLRAELLQEALQVVDVLAAAQLKRVVVEADVADAMLVLSPFGVRRPDPEARLAAGPADGVRVFVEYLKAEKLEQAAVERL